MTTQQDLQDLISQVQAGRDSLAAAIATRQAKIAADQADTTAAQQAVTDGATHRQNDLNALIAANQAAADAQLAAEQAQVAADAADVVSQQATLDLDAQGLAQLDAAIAGLQALVTSAPVGPVVPPVVPVPQAMSPWNAAGTLPENIISSEPTPSSTVESDTMPPFVATPT